MISGILFDGFNLTQGVFREIPGTFSENFTLLFSHHKCCKMGQKTVYIIHRDTLIEQSDIF